MPKNESLKKILVLGSGAIKIGEAGEFDYSGSQCLKAIHEDGINSVLINPNIATIQTDTRFADKVYLLPVNAEYVESIIEKERPDGIMLAYGGQTALNCGVNIDESGILKKYGVNVLGTQIAGIKKTEDRQLFKDSMKECGVPVLKSKTVTNFEDAKKAAKELVYPVIIRVAYTLGGRGGGVAYNEIELHEIVERGIKASLVGQVLVEEYIGHWKQIEYEVMQDYDGNNVIVCNMENVLSMKVHTGDNIVVAPSQTINNHEYHMLRSAALRATKHVGIVGECNIQYALDPASDKYVAIEINPRLSRSSALASKATGYPLAYMSAKIGLGYNLSELVNRITKNTTACFEPSLDYVVCKHPRWDFDKFELVNRRLGPTMKSVGEVMAIGRTFEESFQKAIRMLDIGNDGLVLNRANGITYTEEEIEYKLSHHDDHILYHVAIALKMGISVERIYKLSTVDPWFIEKIQNIVTVEGKLKDSELDESLMWEAKKTGFSDKQIARAKDKTPDEIRDLRKKLGVIPSVKQIDTLAAEWPAVTNYLYLTYGGHSNDVAVPLDENGIIVLGAGPYRIGSSVEFDWGTVNMVWGLQENGEKSVSVVNCNPETVSTDYDICTRLYFEELTQERILDITEFEHPRGIVTCVGGQTANNLTLGLSQHGVNILGTSAKDVDRAEDRSKFSAELDKLHIQQPLWQAFSNLNEAKSFALEVGFPVLVRPSYVLSGAAMKVVWSQEQLKTYVKEATDVSPDHPVVISKFMLNSLEVDVDGISNGKEVVIGAIVEHIDSAGVHSGDAMMVIPPWRLSNKTIDTINEYSKKIALTFNVKGPFNLQFLVHDDHVYVIELNIRASRSMPFVSKLVKTNLISLAAKAILDKPLPKIPENKWQKIQNYGIKVPQFSFMQLEGADISLGVEMQSTGEAACFGNSFYDALSKGLTSVGYTLPDKGSALVTVGGAQNKEKLVATIAKLKHLGFKILATEHTAEFLKERIGEVEIVHKISEPERKPNISDLLYERKIDFIINIPSTSTLEKYIGMLDDEYLIRRKSLELGIPVLTTIELADSFVKTLEWLRDNKTTKDPIEPYDVYE
ncbi:MAG: carbamoyl-phosphate synthase (glutamine-hydrolyzing) large subunit [Nitrosopumilus sp.]|nr:carbamoyl-phosphate synthase (glutamine-hydrolyzing) large subunit [Nitrosopumilus sp.]MDF2423230.1 carbamoyl-phosphate synthase (glutamine-hydrolyzing) large subunit [Nitrosopumilus sp.]MDF2423722.1 carbamoyl-phosphate synthase (glutamine-hydrolyzing) large subunit [Nitrosopumilus sp.]MDF2424928.1 carbamoyl-phosphate synthase (glutamine-hydrolyzing) large subunit [Nitrosopumilus sp.]MDF2427930.1 carbamoyl-phosphate synthase (glutamine-hydrolyzing) large subunit [Nitrosopumilus sp.]